MCFDLDAHPPELPAAMAGGAADGESVVLEAADGNRLSAYAARPTGVQSEAGRALDGSGIVVLPDIRGLVQFYEELALRFAEAGMRAVAIDLYARTAGPVPRAGDFDHYAHAGQTTQEGVAADVAAAVRFLRSDEMGASGALFCVGFCFAGRMSLLQGIEDHGLAGVISFYGFPTGRSRNGSDAPADVADRFRSPVLALYGGADEGIPQDSVRAFDLALERAGVDHESVVYPGAPHSFFDRHQTEYADASADAWGRVLAFVQRVSAPPTEPA